MYKYVCTSLPAINAHKHTHICTYTHTHTIADGMSKFNPRFFDAYSSLVSETWLQHMVATFRQVLHDNERNQETRKKTHNNTFTLMPSPTESKKDKTTQYTNIFVETKNEK